MASNFTNFLLFIIVFSSLASSIFSASVLEDLSKLHPPQDFNNTIKNNCAQYPSLRYCGSSLMDLNEIFKSTIVASHLCNESKNSNCVESFPKIDLTSKPKLATLYLSFDFFWKYCPLSILTIDLSNNSLKGTFPTNVLLCTQIQGLDLSHNQLSGDVPIDGFNHLTNLTHLNLSYNHFTETKMSEAQFFKRFNSSSFMHSGLLPDHNKFKIKAVLLLFILPIIVIFLVVCLGCSCFRKSKDSLPGVSQPKHQFTPSMLREATENFSGNNLIANSEGVDMYRGTLDEGTDVRIEIYRDEISKEDEEDFIEESKILVQLCHKNLVQVLGWCCNPRLRAIVTEWTDGDNVETWLSGQAPPLHHRLKILMGVLEGMSYLQDEWPEIGYDLRTSSILLSCDQEPLISRFKMREHDTIAAKIYKFGVLLLEMITNIKSQEEFEDGESEFVEFIKMRYPENLEEVIDGRMEMTQDLYDQAKKGIGLGLLCTDQSATRLPSLVKILNRVTRVYETCYIVASLDQFQSR